MDLRMQILNKTEDNDSRKVDCEILMTDDGV